MTVFPHASRISQISGQQRRQLGFLLDRLCDADSEIAHALAVAVDGIPMAASRQLPDEVRDRLAAAAAGHMSLASGIADFMHARGVERVVISLGDGWVLIQRPSSKVALVVVATHKAELDRVDDEVGRLVEAIGPVLDPGLRVPA